MRLRFGLLILVSAQVAAADKPGPATQAYMKVMQSEVAWASSVKAKFENDAMTREVCQQFPSLSLPDCYLAYVKAQLPKRTFVMPSASLLSAVGLMVLTKEHEREKTASKVDANKLRIKYGQKLVELMLYFVEYTQLHHRDFKLPEGADKAELELVTDRISREFVAKSLPKVQDSLTQIATQPCLVAQTCPEYTTQQTQLEAWYWRLKKVPN